MMPFLLKYITFLSIISVASPPPPPAPLPLFRQNQKKKFAPPPKHPYVLISALECLHIFKSTFKYTFRHYLQTLPTDTTYRHYLYTCI